MERGFVKGQPGLLLELKLPTERDNDYPKLIALRPYGGGVARECCAKQWIGELWNPGVWKAYGEVCWSTEG